MFPKHKKQTGISIVTALFLIVIMALMGVGMVSLLATSQQSISHEITSARSYMAARTCLQWSMYQMIYDPGTPHVATSNNFNIDTTSNLYNSTCIVNIDAILDTEDNGINNPALNFYNINVTASYGDITSPEYSKRSMRMQYQPLGN